MQSSSAEECPFWLSPCVYCLTFPPWPPPPQPPLLIVGVTNIYYWEFYCHVALCLAQQTKFEFTRQPFSSLRRIKADSQTPTQFISVTHFLCTSIWGHLVPSQTEVFKNQIHDLILQVWSLSGFPVLIKHRTIPHGTFENQSLLFSLPTCFMCRPRWLCPATHACDAQFLWNFFTFHLPGFTNPAPCMLAVPHLAVPNAAIRPLWDSTLTMVVLQRKVSVVLHWDIC